MVSVKIFRVAQALPFQILSPEMDLTKELMKLLLWSFIFSGVYFERSGKCCPGTRNWICEYFFLMIVVTHKQITPSAKQMLVIVPLSFRGITWKSLSSSFSWLEAQQANAVHWINVWSIRSLKTTLCEHVCFICFFASRYYSRQTVHGLLLFPLETVWRCSHISQLS